MSFSGKTCPDFAGLLQETGIKTGYFQKKVITISLDVNWLLIKIEIKIQNNVTNLF